MSTTWIVVAQRAGAKIYGRSTPRGSLTLQRAVEPIEGRIRKQDLAVDRPGRTDVHGSVHHSPLGIDRDPSETEAMNFARRLAGTLEEGRSGAYDDLVLVAEPHFLGLLAGTLSRATADRVTDTIHKDLYDATPDEIARSLRDD